MQGRGKTRKNRSEAYFELEKLAKDLDISVKTINELINERRNLSSELALKLSRYFETFVELWFNLQNQYDIYRVLKNKGKEIRKVRPLKELA